MDDAVAAFCKCKAYSRHCFNFTDFTTTFTRCGIFDLSATSGSFRCSGDTFKDEANVRGTFSSFTCGHYFTDGRETNTRSFTAHFARVVVVAFAFGEADADEVVVAARTFCNCMACSRRCFNFSGFTTSFSRYFNGDLSATSGTFRCFGDTFTDAASARGTFFSFSRGRYFTFGRATNTRSFTFRVADAGEADLSFVAAAEAAAFDSSDDGADGFGFRLDSSDFCCECKCDGVTKRQTARSNRSWTAFTFRDQHFRHKTRFCKSECTFCDSLRAFDAADDARRHRAHTTAPAFT